MITSAKNALEYKTRASNAIKRIFPTSAQYHSASFFKLLIRGGKKNQIYNSIHTTFHKMEK